MSDVADLELLIKTQVTLVAVRTTDIGRVEEMVLRAAARVGRTAECWSLARGLVPLGDASAYRRALSDVDEVLAHIESLKRPGIYLMLDLHSRLADPMVISYLREIGRGERAVPQVLIVAGPEVEIPAELRAISARIELALPTEQQLRRLIADEARSWQRSSGERVASESATVDALVRNLAGVGLEEARRLVRTAICEDGALNADDLPRVMDAKYRLLRQDGLLSFELDAVRLDDIAGLGHLKRWLEQRRAVFLAETPPPGLDVPRGLLLLGVQGAGKSMAAKAVAGGWQLPLLRLDFGTLYNKYYGETERNLREALNTAELMAPCVLWIDEIEKGLAAEGDDAGPGRRVLGTLLTWMAERSAPVFLVATANSIERLPPELLRKGRFDEIFFVDLPAAAARAEIFRIHLARREQRPENFDLAALAAASEGYTGAEIEQAVVSALYSAFAAGESLRGGHLLEAIAATRPLSVLMAEQVAALRRWASGRTVPAD